MICLLGKKDVIGWHSNTLCDIVSISFKQICHLKGTFEERGQKVFLKLHISIIMG